MSTLLSEGRPRRARAGRGVAPSVREVCVLGRSPTGWVPGRRVEWAGRPYRVLAVQGGSSYAFLTEVQGSFG